MAKTMVLPPVFNLLLGVFGLVLLRRSPRVAISLIVLCLLSFYLMSIALVTDRLASFVEAYGVVDMAAAKQCQAIVILSGGSKEYAPEYGGVQTIGASSMIRVRYGAKLSRELGLPLLVTGGVGFGLDAQERQPEALNMAYSLEVDFQRPARWVETESRNTRDHGIYVKRMLGEEGINNIVLVTQAFHMQRSVEVFTSNGFNVVPAPTDFNGAVAQLFKLKSYVPGMSNYVVAHSALNELIGQWWYWLTDNKVSESGQVGECRATGSVVQSDYS